MSLQAWVGWYCLLVACAFLVPFVALGNVASFWGAFFFWCVFAAVSIACMIAMMARWRDKE